jgi:hypothetical protein
MNRPPSQLDAGVGNVDRPAGKKILLVGDLVPAAGKHILRAGETTLRSGESNLKSGEIVLKTGGMIQGMASSDGCAAGKIPTIGEADLCAAIRDACPCGSDLRAGESDARRDKSILVVYGTVPCPGNPDASLDRVDRGAAGPGLPPVEALLPVGGIRRLLGKSDRTVVGAFRTIERIISCWNACFACEDSRHCIVYPKTDTGDVSPALDP